MNVLEALPITSGCLSESEFWSHLDDNSNADQEKHLEHCEDCQQRLGELLGDLSFLRSNYPSKQYRHPGKFEDRFCTGETIGKYEVLENISSGGQGTVYRGWDFDLEREVAIKVGTLQVSAVENERSRIHQEGVFLAEIQHPNLAQIHDAGIHDSHPFLVMEFVEGMTLQQVISSEELTDDQIRQIMVQLTSALKLCHEKRILHLDIKPENIIVNNQLELKLIDFGVSWRTAHGNHEASIVAGTPEYMAPEQLVGHTYEWSERTDIYGLGALLLCLLTGHTPNENPIENHEEWLREKLNNAQCSRNLKRACLKALALNPQDRFGNVVEFQRAIIGDTRSVGLFLMLVGAVCLMFACYFSLCTESQQTQIIEKVPVTPVVQVADLRMFPKSNTTEKPVVR